MTESLIALVLLHSLGFTHRELRSYFLETENSLTPEDFLTSLSPEILRNIRIKDEKIEKILEKREKQDEVKIRNLLKEKNISIIEWWDPLYPEQLKRLGHAPFFLYLRGILKNTMPHIGVVGSRKHTNYAERSLRNILPELVKNDFGIVSGGAYGVDTLAHTIALEQGGYTISIIGTGIDRAYPAENKSLFEKIIAEGGAILSHFPLGTGPEQYNFPMRNELIAGISRGVLIPEAGLSSGTLITAQLALEHGCDVFAIPGDIDRETSKGTNRLIATGQAKCTRNAEDILEEYGNFSLEKTGEKNLPIFASEVQNQLYIQILEGMSRPDALAESLGRDTSMILLELSMMEIDGHITLDTLGEYRVK